MGIDGTIYDVPDSEANAAVFARPSAGPRRDPGFLKLANSVWSSWGPMRSRDGGAVSAHGEQSMFAGLFRHLTSEMLLLSDRGFFSYEPWKQMIARGVKVLARVKSGLIFARSTTWPTARTWQRSTRATTTEEGPRRDCGPRDPLYARRPATGWSRRGHVLITNLFDEDVSWYGVDLLYHERWEEEQVFDEQKPTRTRGGQPSRHSSERDASGGEQEISALSLGHFVIRSLMFEAAATVNLDPTGCRSPGVSRS